MSSNAYDIDISDLSSYNFLLLDIINNSVDCIQVFMPLRDPSGIIIDIGFKYVRELKASL
ncbi:hypothetical protein GCM10027516_38350 [Niabella aquatica]